MPIPPPRFDKLPNVHRVRRRLADGRDRLHFYHRKTRKRLPGKPGSPEFMELYNECERSLPYVGGPTTHLAQIGEAAPSDHKESPDEQPPETNGSQHHQSGIHRTG